MDGMRADVAQALQPYSANDLLALVFLILCGLFLLAYRRTAETYFKGLSAGMLLACAAWGTTRLQSPGHPYVDWAWFWAQPLFAGALLLISLSLVSYLPLQDKARRVLKWWIVLPVAVYLGGTTMLLMLDVKVLRLWAVVVQLPAIIAPAVVAMYCERKEPGMGHFFIGASVLSLPLITLGVALSGSTTLVLRFWTGIPTVVVTVTMLTVSLLRDRRRLVDEIERRRKAEADALEANTMLERKVAERTADLQEMVEGLESFNRNISHDLRGPLGGIDMLAFVAEQHLDRGDIEAAKTQIRDISQQVRHSHGTVDALLLLAKTLEKEAHRIPVDLTQLANSSVREATLAVSSRFSGKKLPSVEVLPMAQGTADPDLMRIIWVNLVSNALKFNLDRTDVVVRLGRDPDVYGLAHFYVSDNGIGFDAGEAARAFEPFQRLRGTANVPGYGLGLNIVRRAVERQGGQVMAESAPGQGTTIRFTVPIAGKR
jgi:signal transduction histidine kinase